MALGKPTVQAILDGAQEIALPAFVSTLCICIVFVPMFFLTGVSRYLFVPLAEAVVFAMLASYVLSRTLIPTLVMWFYRNIEYRGHAADPGTVSPWLRPFAALQIRFEHGFARFREGYRRTAGHGSGPSRPLRDPLPGLLRRHLAAHPAARPGLLPVGRRGPVPAARARPQRDAHRGDHPARGPDRGRDPGRDPGPGARRHARQHRHSLRGHPAHLHRQRSHGNRRCGHSRFAQPRPPAHRRLRSPPARPAQPRLSGDHLLFSARRHREPDDQLRAAGPVRHPDRRPGPREKPGHRGKPRRENPPGARRRGCARAAARRPARAPLRRRPHQGVADRPYRARRGQLGAA